MKRHEAKMARLISFGAAAGALGGAVRLLTAFLPSSPDTPILEALYATTDVGMLFGLIGVYVFAAEAIGLSGFCFFAVALTALASIVGPDTTMFGVDFYRLGAGVFALALAMFSIVLLLRMAPLRVAGALWIACFALGAYAAAAANAAAFAGAGVALGLGFIGASIAQWRAPARQLAAA